MSFAVAWLYPSDAFGLFNDVSNMLRGEMSDIRVVTIAYASFCMQLSKFMISGIQVIRLKCYPLYFLNNNNLLAQVSDD